MIHRLRALNQVKASVTASVTVPIGCQVITEMSTVKWFQFKRVSHVTIVLNGEKMTTSPNNDLIDYFVSFFKMFLLFLIGSSVQFLSTTSSDACPELNMFQHPEEFARVSRVANPPRSAQNPGESPKNPGNWFESLSLATDVVKNSKKSMRNLQESLRIFKNLYRNVPKVLRDLKRVDKVHLIPSFSGRNQRQTNINKS